MDNDRRLTGCRLKPVDQTASNVINQPCFMSTLPPRPPRLPPIHALTAFESAARLGGFAPAAAELCITPSAVSHRIRQLEAHLDLQLFERSPIGVRLTDDGQRTLRGVREAFAKLAHLSRAQTQRQRLSVGCPPIFARHLLIPRLPDFYRLHPDIEIEVAVVAPLQDKPDRHDVDVRIGLPPFDSRPCHLLFADRLKMVATPAYVAAHGLQAPADLARVHLLRSPLAPWKQWFSAAGLDWEEPSRGTLFTDLGMLLEAAAGGMGVGLSISCLTDQWIQSGQLVELFGDVQVQADKLYYMLVDGEQARRPEVAAFSEWLADALSHCASIRGD